MHGKKSFSLVMVALVGAFALGATVHCATAGGKKANKQAQALGLTAAQRADLKPIHANAKAQRDAIKRNTALTPKEKHKQLVALHHDTQAKVSAVLTPAQLAERAKLRAARKAKRKAAKNA